MPDAIASPRLTDARKSIDRQKKLIEQARRHEEQARLIKLRLAEEKIDSKLAKSSEYRQLQKEMRALRGRLHKIRVNLKRKSFSVKSHQSHIKRLEKLLADFAVEEKEKQALLDARTRKVEELRDKLSKADAE